MSFWSVSSLFLLLASRPAAGEMTCSLRSNAGTGDYSLNQEAIDGIRFKTGQSASSLQALECRCGTADESIVDNTMTSLLNGDSNLNNWQNSSVFWVGDCEKLTLQTMGKSGTTLQGQMDGAVFIVENVADLVASSLDLKRTANVNSATAETIDDGVFTSVYFRNVSFSSFPNNFAIQDKNEVVFDGVRAKVLSTTSTTNNEAQFTLDINNQLNFKDPVVRIQNSIFGSKADASSGVSSTENKFKLLVTNSQRAVDSTQTNNLGCEDDLQGQVIVTNNTIGVIATRGVDVQGAKSIVFDSNYIDLAAKESFRVDDAKNLELKDNNLAYVLGPPLVSLAYAKGASSQCDNDDLPASKIQGVTFQRNAMASLKGAPISVDIDSAYTDAEKKSILNDKMNIKNNSAASLCDCDQEYDSTDETLSDSDKVHHMIMEESHCASTKNGVIGSRTEICKGNHPLTQQEREDAARQDTKDDWTTYLIIGVLVSAIVSAIVTALIIKFCCMDKQEVSPRDRPRHRER